MMPTLINTAGRAAVQFYEQSRGNGSHHELALRIATAAWRKIYPETTEDEAEVAVRSAVHTAHVTAKPSR